MEQKFSEIRNLLQTKIFGHSSITSFNNYSKSVIKKMAACHTLGIGVHQYRCSNSSCMHMHYQYHSCGNRHCMNCGGMKREQWIQDRMSELLPTTYFHIVFTLPEELRSVCMGNRSIIFNLLFESSHATLTLLGADKRWLGAQPGIVSILHSNGQQLNFHPHVHCIVSGGGLDKNSIWVKEKRSNGNFIFPESLLKQEYKTYFLKRLHQLYLAGALQIKDEKQYLESIAAVTQKDWNVYAKAPFGGPAQIVEYLGRYTHKVAMSLYRIKEITDTTITFTYKDYKDNDKQKLLTLTHEEFLRRFEQHILPSGFVKIRHAGFMTNRNKHARIATILQQMNLPAAMPKVKIASTLLLLIKTGIDVTRCPKCNIGKMERVATFINVHGALVNIENIKNRGSPLQNKTLAS